MVGIKCECCKTNKVADNGFFCDKCWSFLLPEKGKKGIAWWDIWLMLCHWVNHHDESNVSYDFAYKTMIGTYAYDRDKKK